MVGRKGSIPGKLTALAAARKSRPGLYGDGGGLYLHVVLSGARSWIFRYQLHGKRREMGLGGLAGVPLAKARERAQEARVDLASGLDPIEERNRRRRAARAAASDTFEHLARDFIAVKAPGWKNEKHGAQWLATLELYAFPYVGAMPVQELDVHHILQVLKPIWRDKRETARRVRGRIEAILDYATAAGRRLRDNPARLSLLKHLLPEQGGKVRHHPAMPYRDVAAFVAALRKQPGVSPMALEFTILTAARTSEVIGATCGEFDLTEKLWTVPADRIKAGRAHRVPLPPRALALVKECYRDDPGAYLFPGWKNGAPLSNAAMSAVLDRMGIIGITVHGFRSTFRDWAREQTSYPREVAEAALAHVIGDKTEAAYARGDVLEKRRRLMNDWARYCETAAPIGEVVTIQGKRK